MKKIITLIVLIISGATGWIILEPAISDDVVNEKPLVGNSSNQTDTYVDQESTGITQQVANDSDQRQTNEVASQTNSIPENNVLSGSLVNGKPRYTATGDVYVSGQNLSLVDLNTTGVPDAFVYLSNDLSAQESVRIAKLKGNIGSQNYVIPDDTDASNYKYVLIWCRAFKSLVGYTELQ